MAAALPRTLRRFVLPEADDGTKGEGTGHIYDRTTEEGLILIASDSRSCALPISSDFAPLRSQPSQERLSDGAKDLFSSHIAHRIAFDRAATRAKQRESASEATGSSLHATLHRFTLNSQLAERLNAGLAELALRMEAAAPSTEPAPNDRAAALPVLKSNRGGFQSEPVLFEDASPEQCQVPCGPSSVHAHPARSSSQRGLQLGQRGPQLCLAAHAVCSPPRNYAASQARPWRSSDRQRQGWRSSRARPRSQGLTLTLTLTLRRSG